MIHYINIALICIILYLFIKQLKFKEGLIQRLNVGGNIPNVPHDAACMALHSMGVKIDRMEYLKNKCQGPTNVLNKDDSNTCRA